MRERERESGQSGAHLVDVSVLLLHVVQALKNLVGVHGAQLPLLQSLGARRQTD